MDDKEVKVETVSVKDAEKNENMDKSAEKSDVKNEVAELAMQIADLNDKYLRTAAELENTRRRAAIDVEARSRVRAMSVAEKFLPVMDALDAALKHAPDDEGIQAMARAMKAAFDEVGITKIESLGKVLNPGLHNAIQVVALPEGTEPNTIVEELQTGYMFGDTVLRTAMVVVAK